MEKNTVSEKQGVLIIAIFVMGTNFLLGVGANAKKDAYIATIFGIIYTIPMLIVYSRILERYKGKDFFQILEILFGKIVGKSITCIFIIFSFHLGTLDLTHFSNFTDTAIFPDTPVIIPLILFTCAVIYCTKLGTEVLGRLSEFFAIIIIFLFLIIFCFTIPLLNIHNITPVFYNGIKPVLKAGFDIFTFPFGEVILMNYIFHEYTNSKSIFKTYFKGILCGGIFLTVISLRNLLVLGPDAIERIYYPSYFSIGLVHVGELIQRLEIVSVVIFLMGIYIKNIVCLTATCKGIASVFNINDYKFMASPIEFLMLGSSFFIYKNVYESKEWAFKVWPYYAIIFEIIVPVIVWIFAEIKSRIKD